MHLRIGSRGSKLALWQSNHIGAHLRALGHTTETVLIRTTGDRMQDPAYAASLLGPDGKLPPELDAKGIFIKEIEQALADGKIDLAVHSLKDLPTEIDPRFTIAAIPPRADARDALLCTDWLQIHTLPEGARIGTTSPRRQAQLLAMRPDFRFVAIRGNIDTRIRKLASGECDALVLACAGLDRLGTRVLRQVELDAEHPEFGRTPHMECITHPEHDHLEGHALADEIPGQADWIRERIAPECCCPAPGQGALAIETRAGDDSVIAAVSALDDAETRFAVEAERAVLAALGGGCQLPVGAFCSGGQGGAVKVYAVVTAPDGEQMVSATAAAHAGESAREFGARVAERLLADGARELLNGRMLEDNVDLAH